MLRGWAALGAVLTPAVAAAAGITFGDNGAKAMSLGGAFTGQADDLTALYYNPAGLTQTDGFRFLVDGLFLNNDVTFQRTDANCGQSGQPPCVAPNPIQNSGGIFTLPFLALGYGNAFRGHRFSFALGVYGPPADGNYDYPQPDYSHDTNGIYANDPRKDATQRYGLIYNHVLVAYPTLSAAVALHPRLSVGVSVQYVYSNINFSEAISSNPAGATSIFTENPYWDSVVNTHFVENDTFTGVFGVLARPLDTLSVGASLRPPIVIKGSGVLNIALGEGPGQLAKVTGNAADLELTLPMEIRLGAHWTPLQRVGVNLDVVYEGWHRMQSIVVTPTNIEVQVGSNAPTPLAPLVIPKNWHDTVGVRAGGSYRFDFGLAVRAGLLYDPAAAPEETFNIDFPHLSTVMLTAGVGYELGPLELLATGVFVPATQVTITNSQVVQTNTLADPSLPQDVVGNGTYTTGGWILGVGIRGRFGGSR
jgi:long-chain fatty acid transport protein